MHSSSNFRKGQFFIVTVVGLVSLFLVMSSLISPQSIKDTSEILTLEEPYFFQNVKEKLIETVQMSDCVEIEKNLQTFVGFVSKVASEKGYKLYINYEVVECSVHVKMRLLSPRAMLEDEFEVS